MCSVMFKYPFGFGYYSFGFGYPISSNLILIWLFCYFGSDFGSGSGWLQISGKVPTPKNHGQ